MSKRPHPRWGDEGGGDQQERHLDRRPASYERGWKGQDQQFHGWGSRYQRQIDELDYIVPRTGYYFEHDDRDVWNPRRSRGGPGRGRGFRGRGDFGDRGPPHTNWKDRERPQGHQASDHLPSSRIVTRPRDAPSADVVRPSREHRGRDGRDAEARQPRDDREHRGRDGRDAEARQPRDDREHHGRGAETRQPKDDRYRDLERNIGRDVTVQRPPGRFNDDNNGYGRRGRSRERSPVRHFEYGGGRTNRTGRGPYGRFDGGRGRGDSGFRHRRDPFEGRWKHDLFDAGTQDEKAEGEIANVGPELVPY